MIFFIYAYFWRSVFELWRSMLNFKDLCLNYEDHAYFWILKIMLIYWRILKIYVDFLHLYLFLKICVNFWRSVLIFSSMLIFEDLCLFLNICVWIIKIYAYFWRSLFELWRFMFIFKDLCLNYEDLCNFFKKNLLIDFQSQC